MGGPPTKPAGGGRGAAMAPGRKLQMEIDKTLKRVNDGLRDFEGQWEKMESVPVRPRGGRRRRRDRDAGRGADAPGPGGGGAGAGALRRTARR